MIDTDALCAEKTDFELWWLVCRSAGRKCVEAARLTRGDLEQARSILTPLQRRLDGAQSAHGRLGGKFWPGLGDLDLITAWARDFEELRVPDAVAALREIAVALPALRPAGDSEAWQTLTQLVHAFMDTREATAAAAGRAIRSDVRAAFGGLEVATCELLEEESWREQTAQPDDLPALAPWPGLNRHAITLIGCPVFDFMRLPQILYRRDLAVHAPDRVRDGDHVVFCVNACFGPSHRTEAAVRACAGLDIRPVAIVHTDADAVSDESLHCLVEMEYRELLQQRLPSEDVDAMPLLMDFDPLLREKIVDRIESDLPAVRCAE